MMSVEFCAFLHVFALTSTGSHCMAQLMAEQRILLDALLPLVALALLTAFCPVKWAAAAFLCAELSGSEAALRAAGQFERTGEGENDARGSDRKRTAGM